MPSDWTENWEMLKKDYPIDLTDIIKYCKQFESLMRMKLKNIDVAKENLIKSRGKLFLAINSIYSEFYDKNIFKTEEDLIISKWLKDDLNRVLSQLEQEEKNNLVEEDSGSIKNDRVSLSRITSYYTTLVTVEEGIIYNSLKKAKKEYLLIDENQRSKRIFLYILFLILSNSVGVFGGLAKENKLTKRGTISGFPLSYQTLMSSKGKELLKDAYKEEVGKEGEENLKDVGDLLNEEYFEEDFDDTEND